MQLYEYTAYHLTGMIKSGKVSSREVVESVFKRISQVEESVHAYITLTEKEAIARAESIDKKIKSGERVGELAGIPVAIKDNMNIKGTKTTCASKMLESFISPYDSTVIRKLRDADAVFIGKTNMDEFAMGSSTETSYFGITRNPWNMQMIPGGSSGGSAASISADETIIALGSDTGGSIRQPASCCGVVGLKPTYGRVSRYGLVAFASSLDQIGPITKDVRDSAMLMNVISGYDPCDSTSVNVDIDDYLSYVSQDIKGMKIGVPKEYFVQGIDSDVHDAIKDALDLLERLGAQIVELSLPHTEYAVAVYYLLATAEASSNLARYDGVKYGYRFNPASSENEKSDLLSMYEMTRGYGFGPEVKRRIMLGTYVLSRGYYDAYYVKAQRIRTLIKEDFDRAFNKVDVIITPTSPTTAFKIGEKVDDPLKMYLSDIFTISINLAGIPAISLPCGFARDNLPVGLQIIAKPFDEKTIFRVAGTFEQNSHWHERKPSL